MWVTCTIAVYAYNVTFKLIKDFSAIHSPTKDVSNPLYSTDTITDHHYYKPVEEPPMESHYEDVSNIIPPSQVKIRPSQVKMTSNPAYA